MTKIKDTYGLDIEIDTEKHEELVKEVFTLMSKRIPKATPPEVCIVMSSLLTSVVCSAADMMIEGQNNTNTKTEFASSLLEAISATVRMAIKVNFDRENLV